MTKKRIPWTKEEIDDLMSVKFVRPPIRQDWEIAAVLVNYDYHHARTPDACRRKWGRMKGNELHKMRKTNRERPTIPSHPKRAASLGMWQHG